MSAAAAVGAVNPCTWMCRTITKEEVEKKQLILSKNEMEQYIYAHAPHIVRDIIERKGRVLHIKMIKYGDSNGIRVSFRGQGTFIKKEMEGLYIFGWDAAISMCCPSEGDLMWLRYATMPRDNYEAFEFFITASDQVPNSWMFKNKDYSAI